MREFAKIPPQFWIDHTSKQRKKLGVEAQLVAIYLKSCPHSNMLGVYYLPISFIAHELGMSLEAATKALQSLCEIEFCTYDDELEYIWVHDMALSQVGGQLKLGDNRIKGINDEYHSLPELSFLEEFFSKYQILFYLETSRINRRPLEAPPKPLISKEKEIEKEKEKEKEKENFVAPARPCETQNQDVLAIFDFWKITLGHPNAALDDKRKKIIKAALKMGYSVVQLCDAITGCSLTPHNLGQNDRGQRYDGLHIILGSADQIDRFIRNAHNPPKPPSPPNPADKLMQANIAAGQNWLRNKLGEAEDSPHAI